MTTYEHWTDSDGGNLLITTDDPRYQDSTRGMKRHCVIRSYAGEIRQGWLDDHMRENRELRIRLTSWLAGFLWGMLAAIWTWLMVDAFYR